MLGKVYISAFHKALYTVDHTVYFSVSSTDRYNNTWQWITWRYSFAITNSGTTLTEASNAYGGSSSNSSWAAGVNVYDNHVYKVVGIHRIAGGN